MSLRCRENYSLYKFHLPKVEARNLLFQAPLQLVVSLWPHNEDAPILNSHSEKHEVKKEVPCDINNVERDRETSSCWNKQWRCHHAHWGLEENRVSSGTMEQLNLDIFPRFVALEIGCLFLPGTSVI